MDERIGSQILILNILRLENILKNIKISEILYYIIFDRCIYIEEILKFEGFEKFFEIKKILRSISKFEIRVKLSRVVYPIQHICNTLFSDHSPD